MNNNFKRALIVLLTLTVAFTIVFMPSVIKAYAIAPAIPIIVFYSLISILFGILATELSQTLLAYSDSVQVAPKDMVIFEQGVFYVNQNAFTGSLDDENPVYTFYSTIANALNRHTAAIFSGNGDDLIITIEFNGQTGRFDLQDSVTHAIDVDYATYKILTDLAVTLGFTFNAEFSKNAAVNEVISRPIEEMPIVTKSGSGYHISNRRGFMEFDGVGYMTIMDKRINTDFMYDIAAVGSGSNFNYRLSPRIVPYFYHNNELYVGSRYARNNISATGTTAAIGMPLVKDIDAERLYLRSQANSATYFLYRWNPHPNVSGGIQTASRGDLAYYDPICRNVFLNLINPYSFPIRSDGLINTVDGIEVNKCYSFFVEGITLFSNSSAILPSSYAYDTYLYIPNSYMKLSTGELVNWYDVTSFPDINFIVAEVKPDGTTIDDVLRQPVDNTNEDAGVVLVPAPSLKIPELVDDLINHGLIPDNPDLSIDAQGNVASVDGVPVDEWNKLIDTAIENNLDLTKDIDLLRDLLKEIERLRELERERELAREAERARELDRIEDELNLDIDIDVMRVVDRFPFSLPWDLQYILTIFVEEPEPPVFVFPLATSMNVGGVAIDVNEEFVLDLTRFRVGNVDMVRELIRWSMLIVFVVFLIKITPRILK